MRLADRLGFCTGALRRHGFRTLMLFVAMSIGVAAVIVLTGLGNGARRYVLAEFESLGSGTLIMLPGRQETSGGLPPVTGEGARDLTLADSAALARLPGVRAVAPLVIGSAEISHAGRTREAVTIGSSAEFFAIRKLALAQGRALPAMAHDEAAAVAVIGPAIRDAMFASEPALGQTLRIGGRRFRVIGVLADSGQALGMNRSETVIIPVAAAQQLFNAPGLFRVFIDSRPGSDIAQVKRAALATIAERHDGEEDVTVITQDALLGAFDDVLTALTLAVAAIGGISLLVAGVLVMNVTLIAVTQRTPEIGLLKALGAGNRTVAQIFLTEAGLLALAGAAGGVLLGEALLWSGRRLFPELPFAAPLWAELAAVAVAVGTGLLFALLPARRAARLEPVAALTRRQG